jgi:hypothetical protein
LYDLLMKRASMGETAFLFEHQNEPTDPSTCEWPSSCFTHAAFWFDEWPDDLVVKTLFLDPSKGSQDRDSDYSAFIRFGIDSKGVEYCEADLSNRRNAMEIVADGFHHQSEWKPHGFGIESNTFQDLFKPLFEGFAREKRIDMPHVYLINNTVRKEVRIRRLTAPLVQRRIRFRRLSPGTQLLVDQLRQFPNGSHDDGPDGLDGARRLAFKIMGGRK